MSTVREQLKDRYSWMARSIAVISQVETAAEGLGILDKDFYLDFGENEYFDDQSIHGPYIRLRPREIPGIRWTMTPDEKGYLEPNLQVVNTAPTLADAARTLLPKVGRWEKGFDASQNLLRLTATYKGVRIILQDTPPETCTVQEVEEEEVIPAREEYTVRKRRFRLVGDCDPLLENVTV